MSSVVHDLLRTIAVIAPNNFAIAVSTACAAVNHPKIQRQRWPPSRSRLISIALEEPWCPGGESTSLLSGRGLCPAPPWPARLHPNHHLLESDLLPIHP